MNNQSNGDKLKTAYKKALSTSMLLNLSKEEEDVLEGLSTTRRTHKFEASVELK